MTAAVFATLILLFALGAGSAENRARPAPEFDRLFRSESGWIGADGAFSVDLGGERTLWLFMDTFVGSVQGGKRAHPALVNNSIGIEANGKTRFFYGHAGHAKDGAPEAFWNPEDGAGYLWPFAGVCDSSGLHILVLRVNNTGQGGAFGFRIFGEALADVRDVRLDPEKWKVAYKGFPFCEFGERESLFFGCAALKRGAYIYVYGQDTRQAARDRGKPSSMVVARVADGEMNNFDAWEFYKAGQWQKDFRQASPLIPDMPTEYSVTYDVQKKAFVCVYMEGGISGEIALRRAHEPWGPWSAPERIYSCPEKEWRKGVFCYAAKGHAHLSRPGELVISYASNSGRFEDLMEDARLYWPRFIRVKL